MELSSDLLKKIELVQKYEITEYYVYRYLAKITKDENNSKILEKIAKDEEAHSRYWSMFTKKDIKANRIVVLFYVFIKIPIAAISNNVDISSKKCSPILSLSTPIS